MRCSGAVYSSVFINILHYDTLSRDPDTLQLYRNHRPQNKLEWRDEGGSYTVVDVKAVHGTCMHSAPRSLDKPSVKTVGSGQEKTFTRSRRVSGKRLASLNIRTKYLHDITEQTRLKRYVQEEQSSVLTVELGIVKSLWGSEPKMLFFK